MTKFNHFKQFTLVIRTSNQKCKSKRTDKALANLKRSVRDLRSFKKPEEGTWSKIGDQYAFVAPDSEGTQIRPFSLLPGSPGFHAVVKSLLFAASAGERSLPLALG